MKKEHKILIIVMIILLAFFTRLFFLDIKPLHSDEGVIYFFAEKILNGNSYFYDPVNYHGPFYYYVVALSFIFLGISEFSLRLPAALFGIILIALIIFLKYKNEEFDDYGKYLTAIFIILSPSIFFYSRYSVMESSLILFSFLCIYFLTLTLEHNSENVIYLFIFLALMLATKETGIFIVAAMFFILLFNFKKIKEIKLKKSLIIFSIILFLVIYLFIFTNSFTYSKGFADSIRAYFPWFKTGVGESGHNKPVYYFFKILLQYEFPLLILGLIGIYHSFKSRKIFYKNIAIWFIILFIIYSMIPYKTPWLIINLTLPLCFLSSITITELYKFNKRIAIFILFLSLVYLVSFSFLLNFIYPWQPNNPYAYVQTDKDSLNLVNDLKMQEDSSILIMSKEYWPLPFYLRDLNVSYLDFSQASKFNETKKYDFLILDYYAVKNMNLTDYKEYKLRQGVNLYLIRQN